MLFEIVVVFGKKEAKLEFGLGPLEGGEAIFEDAPGRLAAPTGKNYSEFAEVEVVLLVEIHL